MLRADQLSACTPEAVSPGVASCNTHARRSTPFALRNLLGQTLAARTFNLVFCFFGSRSCCFIRFGEMSGRTSSVWDSFDKVGDGSLVKC